MKFYIIIGVGIFGVLVVYYFVKVGVEVMVIDWKYLG